MRATGKVNWKYERELPGDVFPKLCCDVVNRGVAVYKNKVYLATLDAHIVALDNATGKVVWDKKMGDYTYAETFTIMPMALRNKIIFGTAGAEYGVRGWIAAIDADTGAPVWKTYTIPGPGEPGNDTWPGESWKYGGGSAWITGSYDKETNTLYWPVGNPGPDFDRHVRLGDNLFTNSNLALDPDTGKIQSYFNYTPNDPYDYDGVNEMILVDVGGKKLWLHGSRNGHVYGIDRVNTVKSQGRQRAQVRLGHRPAACELDQADHPGQQLQADLQLAREGRRVRQGHDRHRSVPGRRQGVAPDGVQPPHQDGLRAGV